MASTDGTSAIVELQRAVLDLLTDSEAALARAGKPLGREKHYRTLAKSVAEQRRSVGELELRMAIVAPMKAGKSTIINAILGQGLLPTRNSAMTSLPTEIECANELDQAKLTLDPTLIEGLSKAWKQLHHAIRRKGIDAALAVAASEYPELIEFVRRVSASEILAIESEQHGLEVIRATLADLNDLCRVAPLLSDASPLAFLSAARVPRIAARFVGNSRTTRPSDRLVIVDTPGPNEARQHARLQEVVLEQLQSTSLVLLVLDYTQLNTQAAEQVNLEVQKVMGLVGEDSVFVLVNKIDERNDTGMTTEQVKQFVIGHLKLTDPKATSRIFEVSAKRAFRAASFLHDVEGLGRDSKNDDVVRAMHSTRELAPLIFGDVSWEEDVSEASQQDLERKAHRLWGKSGFDDFIGKAIQTVLADVGPRCLQIALNVVQAHLLTLRNDAQLRRAAIDVSAAQLEEEIRALTSELASLEDCRKALQTRLNRTKRDLKEHLRGLRRRLQSWAEKDVRRFFDAKTRGQESFFSRLKRIGSQFFHRLRLDSADEARQRYVFDDQGTAQEFASMAINYAVEQAQPKLEEAIRIAHDRVQETETELEEVIVEETRPILDRAAQRLQKQFNVKLEMPLPQLGSPFEEIASPLEVTRHIPAGYEARVRYERRWYTLWLWQHAVRYQVLREEQFVVALDDVARAVWESIRGNLDEIDRRFDGFLSGGFKDNVDRYFKELTQYLAFYRQSIVNAQADQQLSLSERQSTMQELDLAIQSATILADRVAVTRDQCRVRGVLAPAPAGPAAIDRSQLVERSIRDRVEIGIITALPKEFAAMEALLDHAQPVALDVGRGSGRRYVVGEIPGERRKHFVVLALLTEMGNNSAAARATLLFQHFPRVRHLIMCGIAGGVPRPNFPDQDVQLGDVVISDRQGVVQYDLTKQEPNEVQHRHPPRPPSAELLEAVQFLQVEELKGNRPWETLIARAQGALANSARPVDEPEGVSSRPAFPRIITGTIASANRLLKDPVCRDALASKFGVKAVEMEGSGIADAAWIAEAAGYLVVRGICDHCDERKSDRWQLYAAIAAAAYVRALLESMP